MIESDQRFIRTCWYIYSMTFVAASALTIYLHLHIQLAAYVSTAVGMLLTGIAFPFLPKHISRIGAVDVLKGLYQDCDRYDITDPMCTRIADNVDVLVRSRGGI